MGFWDFFRQKPVGADRVGPPDTPGAGVGAMRGGVKHGRWKERSATPFTEWKDGKSVPIDYGWTELDYVDGVKQGGYVQWWGNGQRRAEGSYDAGKDAGPFRFYNRAGVKVSEGTYRDGELDGKWEHFHDDGTLEYAGTLVAGKRHGAWEERHPDGTPRACGSYEAGERVGAWLLSDKAGIVERGDFAAGKRTGTWTTTAADGTLLETGTYAADQRTGPWTLHRPDGSLRARGEYREGVPCGEWELGTERYECTSDEELRAFEDFAAAIELVATCEQTPAWIDRVKATFAGLRAAWQVQTRTDKYGQTFASAPIDAGWQLRLSLGVPMHQICLDECWTKITSVLEKLPAERAGGPAAKAIARCGRYPEYVGRDWLTRILDDEDDDPRTPIVSRFEPGRTLERAQLERFARRVPHLQGIQLRECEFPDGLAPMFERGFPELEQLIITRSDAEEGAFLELLAVLGRATWLGKLEQLAILDSCDVLTDAALAALFANPSLRALKYLTLASAALGPATARALAAGPPLESIELRHTTVDAAALAALARLPLLEELELEDCTLPDLTTRQAQDCGPAPRLRTLKLAGTFGIERYGAGTRTGYAVARRLAVMPVLATVEELDLSDNELDELAVRVLARSPYLGKLRALAWSGNDAEGDELEPLREALPHAKIGDAPPRGNVVVIDASA